MAIEVIKRVPSRFAESCFAESRFAESNFAESRFAESRFRNPVSASSLYNSASIRRYVCIMSKAFNIIIREQFTVKAHPALFEGREGRRGAKYWGIIYSSLQLTYTFKTKLQSRISQKRYEIESVNRSYIGSHVWAFEWWKYFRPQVTSKGQCQPLKTLKSNISKTVWDREKVSIEAR